MAVAVALLAFGCSDAGEDGGSVAEPDSAEQGAGEAAPEGGVGDTGGGEEGAGEEPADPQVPQDRSVIYEATLDLVDDDPDAVAEEAWDFAESLGGFVSGDERDLGEGDPQSAVLELRIPSERFEEGMDGLAALAERETGRTVSTEDVTGAVVDLESYIATKSASVERVRALLAEATSVDAILELEAELAEREGELASLEQQLADLEDRVALSTITMTVVAPSAPSASGGYEGPGNFWEGLVSGAGGALAFLNGLLVAIGVILPFVPIAAAIAAAIVFPMRWWRKRRQRIAATRPRVEAPRTPVPAGYPAGPPRQPISPAAATPSPPQPTMPQPTTPQPTMPQPTTPPRT